MPWLHDRSFVVYLVKGRASHNQACGQHSDGASLNKANFNNECQDGLFILRPYNSLLGHNISADEGAGHLNTSIQLRDLRASWDSHDMLLVFCVCVPINVFIKYMGPLTKVRKLRLLSPMNTRSFHSACYGAIGENWSSKLLYSILLRFMSAA